ncbi:MAG: nucleoside hydrolase [Pirellulaceae bacterium]
MRDRVIALLACALFLVTGEMRTMAAEPVRLIFDTDIGNDVDDVLALGVIHALQSRGQCQLLAVTITKDQPLAAEFVDAVNTFYGRGDIPIGIVRDGVTKEEGKFLPLARAQDQGQLRYPHDLEGAQTPEATSVLRQVLNQQPDHSVSIAQVGFSTNLARLLASPPDDLSPLDGVELVRRKVCLLSIMAGQFRRDSATHRPLEYNVKEDVASCQQLMQKWPTPIVFSGFEIGIAVPYPAVSIERDYAYVTHHPLAEAYRLYEPPPHNRPTWDLTSVLYAVFPDRHYFDLSPPGSVTVEEDGFTRWEERDNGACRYLKINDLQVARVTEALVQLSSQPPMHTPSAP